MLTRVAAISVQQVSNAALVQLQCHRGSETHVHSSGRSYFGHSRQWWLAECGCGWVGVGGCGWVWVGVGGCGW